MTKSNDKNPGSVERSLDAAYDGVQALLQPTTTYVLAGVSYTGQAIIQMIAAWVAVFTAYEDAQRTEKTALAQRRQIEPAVRAFLKVLHAFATSQYGAESQELTKLGFQPQKQAKPLDSEQLVLRKSRANATREERGTKGSRQKDAIHGATDASVTVKPDGTSSTTTPSGGAAKTP